jgi:hypothetical protein
VNVEFGVKVVIEHRCGTDRVGSTSQSRNRYRPTGPLAPVMEHACCAGRSNGRMTRKKSPESTRAI